ncbi:MAG: hypothetical protein NC035_08340 [Bacteroides sp.]|nr:hypothetical protein [Bacteroides sp.]
MSQKSKNTEPSEKIDGLIIDAILDRPITFSIDKNGNSQYFFVYRPSLGTSLLSAEIIKELHFDKNLLQINQQYEMLRLCTEQRGKVMRFVAIHTFSRRSDALQEDRVQQRMKDLETLDASDLSTIFIAILNWDTQQEKFIKHIGLDREKRQREKIKSAKKDGNNVTFGGRSLYGSLIDYAAERYGYDYGYILWGISLINLNLMLADSIQSVYLTDKEKRKAHISTDGVYLNADDPKNLRKIQRLIRGR